MWGLYFIGITHSCPNFEIDQTLPPSFAAWWFANCPTPAPSPWSSPFWTGRTRRYRRKRHTTLDWQAAGLLGKGRYRRGSSWVATRWVDLLIHQNLQSLCRTLTWVATYTIQIVSTPPIRSRLHPYTSQCGDGRWNVCWKDKKTGLRSPCLPGSSSQVNQRPCPLNDLLQHSSTLVFLRYFFIVSKRPPNCKDVTF